MATINTVIYTVLFILAASSVSYAIFLRKKILALYNEILELTMQKGLILNKLAETLDTLESKPVEQTDGFLKFVTESRDYAFQFIDTMQKSVQEFEDKTKDVFEKENASEDVQQIKLAYLALKEKTMPEDVPNN